jgi:hypothetical protein
MNEKHQKFVLYQSKVRLFLHKVMEVSHIAKVRFSDIKRTLPILTYLIETTHKKISNLLSQF